MSLRLESELLQLQEKYRFPGATCAYVLPDGTSGSVAVGWHDVEERIEMSSSSRMLAASIGKTFVSAAVLELALENKVSLDDKISKWLGTKSWFSRLPNHETITVWHLLTHSSGLPDHVHLEAFLKDYSSSWQKEPNLFTKEALVGYVLDLPPLFEAGNGWMYSDTGYILLGMIIEEAAQSSYYDVLQERFLTPLHLSQTTPSDTIWIPGLAAGYTDENNPFGLPVKTLAAPGKMAWNPAMEWTGGGIATTSLDLAAWAKILYEGEAMKGNYLQMLLDGVPVAKQQGLFYGAGVVISQKDPLGVVYGHQGVIPGYTSSMRYFPKYRTACAFEVNTDRGVWDRSTQMLPDMESRLAQTIIESIP